MFAKRNRIAIIVISTAAFLFCLIRWTPVGSATIIGEDESFEVIKGFLWCRGYSLYSEVWNNQPPLYTVLLGALFKLFGPSIEVARSLAVAFGVSLSSACYLLTLRRYGWIPASAAAFCLVSSPEVLKLSVSVMLEGAAMGTALWAVVLLEKWKSDENTIWLAYSAALFALALQIKLTAAVFGPALAVEILLRLPTNTPRPDHLKRVASLAIFASCLLLSFSLLSLFLGGSYNQMWTALFSKEMSDHLGTAENYAFSYTKLLEHKEAVIGAIIALISVLIHRDCRRLVLPVTLLTTVVIVHALRRPWWNYYYLHFAIPLALLTGAAVSEIVEGLKRQVNKNAFDAKFVWISAVGLLLFWHLASGSERLVNEVERIEHLPRVHADPVVTAMQRYASETKWVYTRATIFPFHAKLLVIPELAVLPMNRSWSGQISYEELWRVISKYSPEQILLTEGLRKEEQAFLDRNYGLVYFDGSYRLYVANRVLRGK